MREESWRISWETHRVVTGLSPEDGARHVDDLMWHLGQISAYSGSKRLRLKMKEAELQVELSSAGDFNLTARQ